MKEKVRSLLKAALPWGLPAALLIVSLLCYSSAGHAFLGLVFLGLTGLSAAYLLLRVLGSKHPKAAKILKTALTACVILGLAVVSVTLCLILDASRGDEDPGCEYVVVLGAAVRPWGPTYPLQERVAAAFDYMNDHPDAIIVVSGGQGDDEPMSEAACMYDMLVRMGADPDRIWMEDRATSTWENMKFSLELIREKTGQTPQSLGIISNEYHLFRAKLFAGRCGVEPIGIPAHTGWLSLRVNNFLREVAGVWHYILLGGKYND